MHYVATAVLFGFSGSLLLAGAVFMLLFRRKVPRAKIDLWASWIGAFAFILITGFYLMTGSAEHPKPPGDMGQGWVGVEAFLIFVVFIVPSGLVVMRPILRAVFKRFEV